MFKRLKKVLKIPSAVGKAVGAPFSAPEMPKIKVPELPEVPDSPDAPTHPAHITDPAALAAARRKAEELARRRGRSSLIIQPLVTPGSGAGVSIPQ